MTIKHTSLTLLSLLCSPLAVASIANGDFEQWNGTSPNHWSSIDSGIAVSPTTTHVQSGGLAALVTVNTGSQSNTDFMQTIRVEKGKTYPVSVSLLHTEGKVKARLFVDGYQGYSDPSNTQQWQTISHSYTATADKEIQIGLRFYDISGFDGSEDVYIDGFKPTESVTAPVTATCSGHDVSLSLTTDQYASETSWQILRSDGTTATSGRDFQNSTLHTKTICLPSGDYQFVINDSYGDGICCGLGQGNYTLTSNGKTLATGGEFKFQEKTPFTLTKEVTPPPTTTPSPSLGAYYHAASGKSGYALKTELHHIIANHSNRGYRAIWTLVKDADIDNFYDNDGTILDIYSEKPASVDTTRFIKITDQCGQYRKEGECYNREHAFPKSWFGGKVEPMNSDAHHLFATDGFVNAKRSNWPFGEVGSTTYVSSNGSKLGSAATGLGYAGTVFEPIDEFKGDLARAYFYMATRYENQIASWEFNSTNANAVLDGTNTTVFEPWLLAMLKRWHTLDPVSDKEKARNQAIFDYQGNRNPFVDHPEFVHQIWGQ